MLGLKKKLLYCFSLILLSGVSQGAFAWRFGLNTGLYNESIMTGAFRSREVGLRLGFYADRTFNDILYASAKAGNGGLGALGGGLGQIGGGSPCSNNACGQEAYMPPAQEGGGCYGEQAAYAPSYAARNMPPRIGCGSDIGYARAAYNVQNTEAAGKTEIYLVVLPSQYGQYGQPQQQQMPYYQQPQPQAQSYQQMPQMPPQGYYQDSNIDYRKPVRGMW